MAGEAALMQSGHIAYLTPRDCASILFQHRRLVVWVFSLIVGATLLFAILRPPLYRSEMMIVIRLERTDPVVTTDPTLIQRTIPSITDKEVNAELQLLKSEDLLRQVVLACNLQSDNSGSKLWKLPRWIPKAVGTNEVPGDLKIAKAARKLKSDLVVELVPNSALIRISYSSPSPDLSGKVLGALADLYVKKHLAVRRPEGAFDFFNQQADQYHRKLRKAETTLEAFTRENHVASVDAEQQATLRKLTELEVTRHETEASIAVTTQRIQTLQSQMAQVPSRLTTQVRKASGRPPDQLQSTLLNLQLKRTELLGVFQPDYPAVKEVENQIAAADAAIAASQQEALLEETTDRDPTYDWLRTEAEKAKVDLVDLRSRDKATRAMLSELTKKATWLNELRVRENDLLRAVKLAESTYVLYQRKQEEARVSDDLDRQRILNVAIADKPFVPVLPSSLPSAFVVFIGLIAAVFVSGALALGAEMINASFRTPRDVERALAVPVIAAIPERLE